MITTQTADSVLKSYYLGVVSDQLDKTVNPLLAEIKKTASDVWGRDVRKAVRFGVSGGVGAGTEDGDLPKALSSGYAQFVAPLKNLYGTIEVSDKAIRASENNEGAFVNLLNDEMGSLVRSSAFNFSRMLFGDGSGKLASITAIPSAGDPEYTVDSAINLAEGMVVDIYSENTRDTAGAVIASVDRATNKITFEGTVSNVAADDVIYMQNSKDLEITGLKAIFEAEELYGITRTGKSWLTPYTKSSFGAMSEDALQEAIDGVEEYGGGKVNFIVCSRGVRRKLITALSSYRKTDTLSLAGGYTALSFNGIPVVADRFCPKGTMYLLNTDDFGLHQLCDWQWLEGEDGKIFKQIPGKPVYTATLVKYAELMCYRPVGQGMLTGITE